MGKRSFGFYLEWSNTTWKTIRRAITEMTDGFRKIRWQRKKEVEKIFGNALYCL
jgi:hypothetical protein